MTQTVAFDLSRRLLAEALGTAFLLAVVVGSGIMGERLSPDNDGIALLGNTLATGSALVVLILVFGPISGAHFNPVVTLAFAAQKNLTWRCAGAYVGVQLLGALFGVAIAHIMFEAPLYTPSAHARAGIAQGVAEFVATFGLIVTIFGCLRTRPDVVAFAVGLFITAGYWFTASTSFANPAVTIARSLTDTFSGIRPQDAPGFIISQCLGAVTATYVMRWLWSGRSDSRQG